MEAENTVANSRNFKELSMKIGILTMSYRRNYGGILQCIALQNTLRKMGHDVQVINFRSARKKSLMRRLKLLVTDFDYKTYRDWLSDKAKDFLNKANGKKKPLPPSLLEKCGKFIKENISYTELCNEDSIGHIVSKNKYDAIVIGSDKIWGSLGYSQLVYFGDWKPSFYGKLISYAACSSMKKIPRYNKSKISGLLSHFNAVSVRDRNTYDVIAPCCQEKPQIVADPTLLYDFKDYLHPYEGNEYIFAYILGREIDGGHHKAIEKIRDKYGKIPIKAIVLTDESMDMVQFADEVHYDATPEDWINMLAHASFVYTDSFHGVLFSLKYHKSFVAYYKEASRASRLLDLKERFPIGQNIVTSVSEMSLSEPDYKMIDSFLDKETEKSRSFLESNL